MPMMSLIGFMLAGENGIFPVWIWRSKNWVCSGVAWVGDNTISQKWLDTLRRLDERVGWLKARKTLPQKDILKYYFPKKYLRDYVDYCIYFAKILKLFVKLLNCHAGV